MNPNQEKVLAAWISVASNTTLIIAKLVTGFLIQSVSVMSEAIHSGVDLIASFIALVAVRQSGKPADIDHPYGHGKSENISGALEAGLIFVAAVWIIYEAIAKLVHTEPMGNTAWGVGVMLASVMANLLVSRYLFRVSKKTDSLALEADAWHLRTDVYTSAGVTVGLLLIWIGERTFPGRHFHWIDPIAAIAVALLIIRAAWRMTIKSSRDLMDSALPTEEIDWIRAYVQKAGPRICGFHELRTRRAGAQRFVEFHLLVEGDLSLTTAHDIAEDISAAITQRFPHTMTTIHVEPCDGECSTGCLKGCFLPVQEQARRHLAGSWPVHPAPNT